MVATIPRHPTFFPPLPWPDLTEAVQPPAGRFRGRSNPGMLSAPSAVSPIAMSSKFVVQSAAGYDHFMGRWSLRLAPLLIDFAGVHDGDHVLT